MVNHRKTYFAGLAVALLCACVGAWATRQHARSERQMGSPDPQQLPPTSRRERDETQIVDLPGLRVSVPIWEMKRDQYTFETGLVRFMQPNSRGLRLHMSWGASDRFVPAEELSWKWNRIAAEVHSQFDTVVAGHRAHQMEFSVVADGHHQIVTHWYCDEYKRGHEILSFLAMPPADQRRFHAAIIAGVTCHTPYKGERARISFPSLAVPTSYSRTDDPTRVYEDEYGNCYGEGRGLPGRVVWADGSKTVNVALFFQLGVEDLEDFVAEGNSPERKRRNNEERFLWKAHGNVAGTKCKLTLVNWYCGPRDTSFAVWHVTRASTEHPGNPETVLLAAACH